MGYYTYYTMEARGIKGKEEFDAILDAMKDQHLLYDHDYNEYGIFTKVESDYDFHIAFFNSDDEAKWYDNSYDMMKFSRLFPDVTFRLSGDGEDRDDSWHKYFHNGEIEECRAKIIFPSPERIEWEE